MKQLTTISLTLAFVAMFASCDNEDAVQIQSANKDLESINNIELLNITYEGKTYENVPTSYDENGEFVFLDEEFASVYAVALAPKSDWSISAKDSHNITFYSNLDANLQANRINIDTAIEFQKYNFTGIQSRNSYANLGYVTLYDDKNFKDRNYSFILNDTLQYYEEANLGISEYKFNDKCSSLILINNIEDTDDETFPLGSQNIVKSKIDVVFIGYDDKNFSDRTITCVAHAAEVMEYESLPGFNDKMSSFKFFFAQKDQYRDSF